MMSDARSWIHPTSFLIGGRNLMAKQSFVYLLRLRSVSFGLVATTTDGTVAFDVEDDEGMG
jgi:hypothetical protein